MEVTAVIGARGAVIAHVYLNQKVLVILPYISTTSEDDMLELRFSNWLILRLYCYEDYTTSLEHWLRSGFKKGMPWVPSRNSLNINYHEYHSL